MKKTFKHQPEEIRRHQLNRSASDLVRRKRAKKSAVRKLLQNIKTTNRLLNRQTEQAKKATATAREFNESMKTSAEEKNWYAGSAEQPAAIKKAANRAGDVCLVLICSGVTVGLCALAVATF